MGPLFTDPEGGQRTCDRSERCFSFNRTYTTPALKANAPFSRRWPARRKTRARNRTRPHCRTSELPTLGARSCHRSTPPAPGKRTSVNQRKSCAAGVPIQKTHSSNRHAINLCFSGSVKGYPHRTRIGIHPELSGCITIYFTGRMPNHPRCGWALSAMRALHSGFRV